MSAARRPLLTAVTAGTLLCALWFVPSANASAGTAGAGVVSGAGSGTSQPAAPAGGEDRLADTGAGPDTTPYLLGGTAFLGVGAGFVALGMRRHGRAS
ncbi:hypothetical protein [Streptomyces sp. CC208A]|uniref:hypothetical protein n=1 Tax=Streptomyces sp. CC208A TaxID=3044573 RepID=UPI0024A9A1F0|nr:hypothetical protein [Streptomyces sp. CC208A]